MDAYAKKHQGSDAVARYQRKLSNRIDRLRHDEELALLSCYARGKVYDCTIGVGRFIGRLPAATSYHGADLSQEFVDYVTGTFPGTSAKQADLTRGIAEPDNTYDTVICLRSLSAIGKLDAIIPEMIRITAPGGCIIVDYGRRATRTVLNGIETIVDGENFDEAINHPAVDVVEDKHCDGFLTRLKSHARLFRLINGRYGQLVPDAALLAADRLLTPMIWQRRIVVLRKRS